MMLDGGEQRDLLSLESQMASGGGGSKGRYIKREVEQWKRKVSQLCSWRKDLPGVIIAQEEVKGKSPLFLDHEPRPSLRKRESENKK